MNVNSKLITRLEQKKEGMSKAHRKIAEYIIENPEQVYDMSITELADACGVGGATVSRFCDKLDLQGYLGLKVALFHYGDVEVGKQESFTAPEEELGKQDCDALDIVENYKNALQITQEKLDMNEVRKVVAFMEEAQQITFYGIGSSHLNAEVGFNKFYRGVSKVKIVPEGQRQFVSASMMGKGDLALIVSYSGATKEAVELAKIAKSRGANVICISHYAKSPISVYCDSILISEGEEKFTDSPSMIEHICVTYIFDVLYAVYVADNKQQVRVNEALSSTVLLNKVY